MTPGDPLFWLITLTSFFASAISGAFAIGGGFLMLAVIASILPISAVVPMHSALMLGTSIGRSVFFWRYVHWPITIPFVLGCLIGAPAGARIHVDLPEVLIALVVGLFILAATWFPPVAWRPQMRHPFLVVGLLHSFLSAMFSFGGLMQPLIMRTKLEKKQIIATLAVSLLFMNAFKLGGYAAFGFDFRPYLVLIVVAVLAGVAGAAVGKHLVDRIPEKAFRRVFKLLVTAFAIHLLYRAWTVA
jgi:uncharacterized membrane protein YfcA